MLKYFYTTYGEVYAGWEFEEMEFPDYTIVVQGTKLRDYRELKHDEKTLEKISEYGWVLPNSVIVGWLGSNKFKPETNHINGDSWDSRIKRTSLFIIGAGASAFCGFAEYKEDFEKDNLRPPLGPGLFNKRFKSYYSKYKGVKQSLQNLQFDENEIANNPTVEDILEDEWQEILINNNENLLSRHINLQYYLQDILKDVSLNTIENYYIKNLYAVLAYKLQKIHSASIKTKYNQTTFQNFSFVSFNQDNILEHFIGEYFKRPINIMNDYADINGPYCIFKPHGSWNWGWKFPDLSQFGVDTPGWLFDNNINFHKLYYELLGNHKDMIDWSTWGLNTEFHKYDLGKCTIDKSQLQLIGNDDLNHYFPALLLPYRDKDEFTMPLKHYLNMRHNISQVETLIIIGWKGNEEAFNKVLFTQGKRINKIVIADPHPEIVEKYLQPLVSKISRENIKHYKSFEDFVINGLDKEIC
jgi:hypothetical protein